MDLSLNGKTIVVTGGFGVLGQAVGVALAAAGAQVALIDKAARTTDIQENIYALGGVDLGNTDDAHRAIAEVVAKFGGLNGLVNVAGGFRWETIEEGSVETWDQLYAINVRTALITSQAALPHLLLNGGRIVNIGALAANLAGLGMGAYAASKAGVARLTEAMAEEVKDRGVTVNAVLPSIINTPTNRADMPQADFSHWVSPCELAQVVVFLQSKVAAPITGALIPVRGRV